MTTHERNQAYFDESLGMVVKKCKECGKTKPITEYPNRCGPKKDKHYPASRCKPCFKAYWRPRDRARYQRPERHAYVKAFAAGESNKAKRRAAYAANPIYRERAVAHHRRKREENREAWSYKKHNHYISNRDTILLYLKEWRDKNRDYIKLKNREYREKNGEKLSKYEKQRRMREERRQQILDASARRRARIAGSRAIEKIRWDYIIERDKSTCYLCRRRLERREITFDHVVPLAKKGPHTEGNIRVACRTCNSRKGAKLLHEFLRDLERDL
ncbi:MAG: HNH endonuclease [Blastocatellia bacterium]